MKKIAVLGLGKVGALTAIPTACFWPTNTTSFLPLVMPV